jgi:hypothetical protein
MSSSAFIPLNTRAAEFAINWHPATTSSFLFSCIIIIIIIIIIIQNPTQGEFHRFYDG